MVITDYVPMSHEKRRCYTRKEMLASVRRPIVSYVRLRRRNRAIFVIALLRG